MKTVLLGSTGMLGSEVSRVFRLNDLDVLEFSRGGTRSFDARKDSFLDLAKELLLTEDDFVINAIGWIPQKKSGRLSIDRTDAYLLNAELPKQIATSSADQGFRWLQIGTDCVYAGKRGSYIESDQKDAGDLYGRSKIEGEENCENALLIRCSIIGPDSRTSAGLYSWFKSKTNSDFISGFTNHLWNGVTTTAFAKLALGLRNSDLKSLNQHWVPSNQVSKFELLEMFRGTLQLQGPQIEPVETEVPVDRTLSTSNAHLNEELWRMAGYDGVPSIEHLIKEMIDVDVGGDKRV